MMQAISHNTHKGPPLGILAIIFTVLFNTGLSFVISFSATSPHFPGPWESAEIISTYFQGNAHAVLMCAFFQFGSAIPLGLYAVTLVSRLNFLGIRAAGSHIALFGGLLTVVNLIVSSLILWAMAYPNIAQDSSVIRALYYLTFAIGGVGFSVPIGIFFAGVSVTAYFTKLLPRWLVWCGLALALFGQLSWFSLIFPNLLFFIPLTRFLGFTWLITAGFMLPKSIKQNTL